MLNLLRRLLKIKPEIQEKIIERIILPETNVQVKIVNDDCNHIHDTLGITMERADKLVAQINEFLKKGDINKLKTSSVLEYIGSITKHPNELSYLTFLYGNITGSLVFNPMSGSGPPKGPNIL